MSFSAPHSPLRPAQWTRATVHAAAESVGMEEHKAERDGDVGAAGQEEEDEYEMKPRAPTDHAAETADSGGGQHDGAGTYDSMLWSRILDEQGDDAMALSADEEDAGDERNDVGRDRSHAELLILPQHDGQAVGGDAGGTSATPRLEAQYSRQQSGFDDDDMSVKIEPSVPFDHWAQPYDPEIALTSTVLSEFGSSFALPQSADMTSAAATASESPSASTLLCLPSSNLSPMYDGFASSTDAQIGASHQSSTPQFMPGATVWQRPHVLSFGSQSNGFPFPLSKPLIRDDGLLLVGTESTTSDARGGRPENRIFVSNFIGSASPMAPTTSHIVVEQEVRDLQWMNASVAVAAIGNEVQMLLVGNQPGSCQLLDPIPTIHGDAIRELAVQTSSCLVLSGGFDHTIVLSNMHDQHNPGAASLVSKYDAHDVVSSLRWSLSETEFSWTTDGGNFKVVDTRARSSPVELQMSVEYLNETGGLFTHEYLSNSQVALGFERGQVALVDIRMPRNDPYAVIRSSLATVGEIRRAKQHQPNKFAIFGYGGFATAQASVNQARQLILGNVVPLQEHQIGITRYKTSGDYSFENGDYLAVTDNLGTVSLYNVAGTKIQVPQQTEATAWRL